MELLVVSKAPDRILTRVAASAAAMPLRTQPDLPSASDPPPDILLVDLPFPEAFPPASILRALEAFPLARWIVLLGSYSETAARSGLPWPLSLCVPFQQADDRLARELSILRGDALPLPITASREEIVEAAWSAASAPSPHDSVLRAQWRFPDRVLQKTLETLAATHGVRTVARGPIDLLFVDIDLAPDPISDILSEDEHGPAAAQWIAVSGAPDPQCPADSPRWATALSKLSFSQDLARWRKAAAARSASRE